MDILNYKNILLSRKNSYNKVFSTPEGRAVLTDLYRYCGINKPSYTEGKPDSTAHKEGKRLVALHIQSLLKQTEADVDSIIRSAERYRDFNQGDAQ